MTGNFEVYSDAKFLNDKGVMTRTLTLKQRVLMGSLPTMPEIHNLFTRHRLEWTARPLGRYSEELVREFYPSDVATLRSQIDRQAAPAKQAPLEQVRVRGVPVDISLPGIRRFLYARMLMLIGPLLLPSLTTDGRLSKIANFCVSHR